MVYFYLPIIKGGGDPPKIYECMDPLTHLFPSRLLKLNSHKSTRVSDSTSATPSKLRRYRLITLTRRSSHITPIIHSLHWLPVQQRIVFEILIMVFLCLHNIAPTYLQELVQSHTPTRRLYVHPMQIFFKSHALLMG